MRAYEKQVDDALERACAAIDEIQKAYRLSVANLDSSVGDFITERQPRREIAYRALSKIERGAQGARSAIERGELNGLV